MNKDIKETKYFCPLCKSPLYTVRGDSLRPHYGWTVYCPSLKCPAQEVQGHAKTEQGAYAVIMAKFKGEKITIEDEDNTIDIEAEIETPTAEAIIDKPALTTTNLITNPIKRGRGRPPKNTKPIVAEEDPL